MDGVGESPEALTGFSFAAQGSATQESSRARQASSTSSQGGFVPAEKGLKPASETTSEVSLGTPVSTANPSRSNAVEGNAPSQKPVSENSQSKSQSPNSDPGQKTAETQGEELKFRIDNTALQYRFVETAPPKTTHATQPSSKNSASQPPKGLRSKQLVVVVVDEESGKVVRQLPQPPPKYFKDDEFKKIKIGSHVDKRG